MFAGDWLEVRTKNLFVSKRCQQNSKAYSSFLCKLIDVYNFFSKAGGLSKTITLSFPAVTLRVVLDFLYTGQAGRIQGN